MASICALREYETEEHCKKECEFYKGNGECLEDYDTTHTFCAYQMYGDGSMNIPKEIENEDLPF